MGTLLLYLTTVIIWGTTWYAITFQLGVVPVEWSLVYRFGLAAILLMVFCKITGRSLTFPRKAHLIFFGLGFFLFAINYYFNYLGVKNLTSGLVAVIFSMLTFLNIINGALFLKRKLAFKNIIAAVIGLTGIILVFSPEFENINFSFRENGSITPVFLGIGFTLLATYFASLGNTLAHVTRDIKAPVLQANAWGMAYGTLLLIAFAVFSGKPLVFDTSTPFVLSLLYLSVFGTVIAFSAYLILIGRLGMEKAGYVAVMMPIVALIVSTFLEGYNWTPSAAIGVTLTIIGNIMVLRKDKEPSPNPQVEAAKV
jgi:drug/metabolite transporter (DMT)-like permease